MKKNYLKLIWSLFGLMLLTTSAIAQKQTVLWTQANQDKIAAKSVVFKKATPKKATLFSLDVNALKNALNNAPKRNSSSRNQGIPISFPNQDGKFETYLVQEASVMTPELQDQFPEIRSYVGKSLDNPTGIIRFSMSPQKGLSSMVLSDQKTVFIEPYTTDLQNYIVFVNSVEDKREDQFICETEYSKPEIEISDEEFKALKNANDGLLRTYRLALACTVEYSLFHGGNLEGVLAAMNTTMTRVNGVYERDLSVTMVLVPNQSIIFLGPDPNSDPYTNSSGGTMLGENQTTCDNNIGTLNYDVGHVFSTGGGGIATLRSPCNNSTKARGVTGSPNPVGDTFDIDYVAHELGHQFGGNHTQNNNCQRSSVSVEPGSASTIMGYAGICNPNVQNNSDDYFHGENIKEMWLNISTGISSTCFAGSATGNVAPIANAGPDYAIPKSTAFVLRGSATDANDASDLTYGWEQNDTEPAQMPPQSTNAVGPLFRSLDPSRSPNRYMPILPIVMNGSLASTWEVVPSVARTMSFLLTVRDNEIGGGGSDSDEMQVSALDVTPFTVNTPPSWAPNSTQQVTWVVGETAEAAINCQSVNVLFTINNGTTFTTLASGVPNTGSATITVPNVGISNTAKVLVEAADNIFYAVSDAFTISTSPDFSISSITGNQTACNVDAIGFDFNFNTSNGFSETTTFSVSGLPAGANSNISPSALSAPGTLTLDVTNLTAVAQNNYTITLTATSNSITKSVDVDLLVTDNLCASEGNLQFQTRTTGVSFNTIDNPTPGSKFLPYTDFTNISTDVEAGQSYDLSINVNSDGNFQVITKVWIDWNQNCSFDPEEEYDLGTTGNVVDQPTTLSPLSLVVPSDAAEGTTVMRVSTKYTNPNANQFPTSCEIGFDGEVEDYSINVTNSLSVYDNELENLSIYPNPNNGEFNISFNPKSGDAIQIEVYDIRGRAIFNTVYESIGRFDEVIRLNEAQSGVYLLRISDGSQKVTKRIIID